MSNYKNAYEILGIEEGSDIKEIKKKYYQLIKKYHPDLNPGDYVAEEKAKMINMAYITITNGKKEFYYSDTPIKSMDFNREKNFAIKQINELELLLDSEKNDIISKIKLSNDIQQVKALVENAKNLNSNRKEFKKKAIQSISQCNYLNSNEKQSYIDIINRYYLESDISIILQEAKRKDQLNKCKEDLLKSLNLLTNIEKEQRKRYYLRISNAQDIAIARKILEEAKEKNDELKLILERKAKALSTLKTLYFSTSEDQRKYTTYINTLDSIEAIEEIMNMAIEQSKRYEPDIKIAINRVIKKYQESFLFNESLLKYYIMGIHECRSLDMIEAYEIAIPKLESIFANSDYLTVSKIDSKIEQVIQSTNNAALKRILLTFKSIFMEQFLRKNIFIMNENNIGLYEFDKVFHNTKEMEENNKNSGIEENNNLNQENTKKHHH